MARYDRDGSRIATTIFEAAAWHNAIMPVCSQCSHSAIFDPHGLWWRFHRKGWNDNLRAAVERFWCLRCRERLGIRVRPRVLELVRETRDMNCLAMPPEREWKRAIKRFRT